MAKKTKKQEYHITESEEMAPEVSQWEAIKMWDAKFRVTPDPAIISWETMEKVLKIKIKR